MTNELPSPQEDGSVLLEGKKFEIPGIRLCELLGSGANGYVFWGLNLFLDRNVVVKVWVKIRTHDSRDKFIQGAAEARKMSDAAWYSDKVVGISHAGIANGHFYTIMEFWKCITLAEWLEVAQPRLTTRCEFAGRLLDFVKETTSERLFHGDLHPRNVLVEPFPHRLPRTEEYAPAFKIIDFGTSAFASREYSRKRHWEVFNRTFNSIVFPLNINDLAGEKKPSDYNDANLMFVWYDAFLREIPKMLVWVGAHFVLHEVMQPPSYEGKQAEVLRGLVDKGLLPIDIDIIGSFTGWQFEQESF